VREAGVDDENPTYPAPVHAPNAGKGAGLGSGPTGSAGLKRTRDQGLRNRAGLAIPREHDNT
jgi:hypothetical protein